MRIFTPTYVERLRQEYSNDPEAYWVNKFGMNADVDTNPEDIWDGGGDYGFYPATAQSMEIVSSSDNDGAGDESGAEDVKVFGLDGNWKPKSETVTLNGTSAVPLVNKYIRVFRAYVVSTGGDTGANGTITVRIASAGTTAAQITLSDSESHNQTLMAIYTVPAGYRAYVCQTWGSILRAASAVVDMSFLTRSPGEVFRTRDRRSLASTGASHVSYDFPCPFVLEEKTDIKVRAVSSAVNSQVTAGFSLMLVPA